jgi:hypothetical protein
MPTTFAPVTQLNDLFNDVALSGSPAQGSVFYRNGSGKWSDLAPSATVGAALVGGGAGANPQWGPVPLDKRGDTATGQMVFAKNGSLVNDTSQDALIIQPSTIPATNYRGLSIYKASGDTTPSIWTDTSGFLYQSATGVGACRLKSSGNAGILEVSSSTGLITVGRAGANSLLANSADTGIVFTGSMYFATSTSGATILFGSNLVPNVLQLGAFAGSRTTIPLAPPSSANFGSLSLGAGPFDGTTTGFFAGSASGTQLAINAASGYAGDFVHHALAGVTLVKVKSTGQTVFAGLGSSVNDITQDVIQIRPSGTVAANWRPLAMYLTSAGTTPGFSINADGGITLGGSSRLTVSVSTDGANTFFRLLNPTTGQAQMQIGKYGGTVYAPTNQHLDLTSNTIAIRVANVYNATSPGIVTNTDVAVTTAFYRLFGCQNNGTTKFYVDKDGAVNGANFASNFRSITTTTSLDNTYGYVLCDATSAAFTVTLPAANTVAAGTRMYLQKKDSSANAVTVSRASTDTINGATTFSLAAQYNTVTLVSDGVGIWYILASR